VLRSIAGFVACSSIMFVAIIECARLLHSVPLKGGASTKENVDRIGTHSNHV